jgi:flavin reductase (DIM6/NTAB) family NADH-FMN oxidoreductase RutF
MWAAVEKLAPLTGRNLVPEHKLAYGCRFEPRKFEAAGLHPMGSLCISPPRVAECPLQFEARVGGIHVSSADTSFAMVEAHVVKVHVEKRLIGSDRRYVLPEEWHPLIYNFRHYFGLGPELGRSFRSPVRRSCS